MLLYELDGISFKILENGEYWVVLGVYVIGKVEIGEDVGIWFNVMLCGDNELIVIGVGLNIQENMMIYMDFGFLVCIGVNCIIGYSVIIYGCIIGDNLLIGMGVMVFNGVKIGNNCFVGVNVLVIEGKEFLDNLLIVGVLVCVICMLEFGDVVWFGFLVQNYVCNWKCFWKGFKEIFGS